MLKISLLSSLFIVSPLMYPAFAQEGDKPVEATKWVPAGLERKLRSFTSINENTCEATGEVIVRIQEQPANGSVRTANENEIRSWKEGTTIAAKCNGKRSPGIGLWYRPDKGFVGTEIVKVLVMYPNSSGGHYHFIVNVQ